jgi:hypothetical protein
MAHDSTPRIGYFLGSITGGMRDGALRWKDIAEIARSGEAGFSVEGAIPGGGSGGFLRETVEDVSAAAQTALTELVPGTRHSVAAGSGAMIQLDQPEVVDGVRNPASWASTTTGV